MKQISKIILIIGILGYILGCSVARPKGKVLIIRLNNQIVVEENVGTPPKIVIGDLNFFIEWKNLDRQSRLFIGSRKNTSILIKGNIVRKKLVLKPREKQREKKDTPNSGKFKFLEWGKI